MARELDLIRVGNTLHPANERSLEELQEISLDRWVKGKITEPRNWLLTKKWFALLDAVFPHQDTWPTFESFRKAVTVALGFGQEVISKDGRRYLEADSIAINKMDEDTFQELYKRTELLVLEKILPGVKQPDLDEMVEDIMKGGKKRRG